MPIADFVDDDGMCWEEAWERTDPPEGDGWQLWETVSEGSPISPVFPTADGLIDWLCTPAYNKWGGPLARVDAEALVRTGWMPSMITTGRTVTVEPGGTGLAGMTADKEE